MDPIHQQNICCFKLFVGQFIIRSTEEATLATYILLAAQELPWAHFRVCMRLNSMFLITTFSNKIVSIYTFLVLFLLHLGSLKEIPAPKLGALAIKDSLSKIKLPLDAVEEVLMGCVVQVSMYIRVMHGFNMSFKSVLYLTRII